jgi:hypothetical protein
MDEQKQQLIERIRQAQNILVTVSANPSVDQLSAAIGLTIALNKLDKHGTAVFSGQIPSTIEFLKPEETLEKNTDSLRDFIIALDKSKADKLRYKVEDQVVRIFITPYKTSLSQADLNFSQGDFNVDVVIALGVTDQQDLDTAITAHGRILHDATVASVTVAGPGSLGTINWADPAASSLSEMMAGLADGLDKKLLDGQIATALLTGIVATTERFSNEKTSPRTMSVSAQLMSAGANPQLIATELAAGQAAAVAPATEVIDAADADGGASASPAATDQPAPKREPGTLEIHHDMLAADESQDVEPAPEPEPEPQPQIHVDDDGGLHLNDDEPLPQISKVHGVTSQGNPTDGDTGDNNPAAASDTEVKRGLITGPPKMGDPDLTANTSPEAFEPSTEELTLPAVSAPLLTHNESVLAPPPPPMPAPDDNVFIPQAPPAPQMPSMPAPARAQFTPPPPAAQFVPPLPPVPPVPAAFQPPVFQSPAVQPPLTAAPSDDTATLEQIEASVKSPHVQIGDDGTFSNGPEPSAPASASAAPAGVVDDARSAVAAAFAAPGAPSHPIEPIAALNAQPLGPSLHAAEPAATPPPASAPQQFAASSVPTALPPVPAVPNTGFSEPTPGSTPADDTLDMPLPSNPFGPGQQMAPPTPLASVSAAPTPASTFPGAPAPQSGPAAPPPPVPPPMFPPVQ